MSTSHEFLGFPARRAPEKSKFSRTCSLLSQYLKENGNFGALSFGIASDLAGKGNPETMRPATTLDLLPKIEMPKEDSPMKESASEQRKTWTGMLSQRVGSGTGTSSPVEEVANSKDIDLRSGSEQGSSQMTIFYAGKVLVFNNLPASKAKELMLLASKGTSQNVLPISLPSNGSTTNSSAYDHPATLPQQQNHKAASISGINSPLDNLRQSTPTEGFANSSHKTYMPIARKASLHRFLEKRKDRVNSKAPYQVNQASSTQREPEETNAWLGLFPQSN